MGNWAEEVFAPIEAHNRESVAQNTWGHLAPKKNKTYRGKMLISHSEYSTGITITAMEWEGLPDSPWLYDSVNDFLWNNRKFIPSGGVYIAQITMRNYRYWLKITEAVKL